MASGPRPKPPRTHPEALVEVHRGPYFPRQHCLTCSLTFVTMGCQALSRGGPNIGHMRNMWSMVVTHMALY
eukprot:2806037-Pyramimonas_sp.AAC.1